MKQAGRATVLALLQVLVALQLLAVFGELLRPGRALTGRDIAEYQVPLRATLAQLAGQGLPEWNPLTQGGQPLLSDPSYAAFYPLNWLVLVLAPHVVLSILAAVHAALAAFGARRLAKALGCREAIALLAATGYASGGLFVSLLHAQPMLPAMAWLPWLLTAADRLVERAGSPGKRGPAILQTALFYALIALAGEPATLLAATLSVALLALTRRPAQALWPASAGLLGLGLAAVQLVPAAARLLASPRAGGLTWEQASRWSMQPIRLVELVFPRLLGDPARMREGLYYGWGIHDFDFPYLLVLTPGLSLVVLGFAGLLARGLPRRRFWALLAISGVLLACGRHTPGFRWAFDHLPGLATNRYPEKFFLLTFVALVFAGACALERLLARREAGAREATELPLALALVAGALVALLGGIALAAPGALDDFLVAHRGLAPAPEVLERARSLYRSELLLAFAVATALAAILALARFRQRPSSTTLIALLWLLTAGELTRLSGALVATVPASLYLEPPPLARAAASKGATRFWSTADIDPRPELYLRGERSSNWLAETRLARLDPSVGVLWGFRYALSVDFALTLTPPARRARLELERLWRERRRDLVHRLLGAWSVDTILVRRGPRELFLASRAGEETPLLPATLAANPRALPWARTVPVASLHPDGDAALAAAIATGLPLGEREFLVTGERGAELRFDPAARVVAAREAGDRIEVEVAARGPALLVVATTHDPGWSAARGGEALSVLQSGAGYLAVPLPPGGGTVRLVYRDPWLRPGAAVSGAALVALLGLAFARRRPKPAPAAP